LYPDLALGPLALFVPGRFSFKLKGSTAEEVVLLDLVRWSAVMVNLLIVSGRLENKQTLVRIIAGLPVNVYTTGTLEQAQRALLERPVDLILCDENLPDGTYRDFLRAVRSEHKTTRFVVLLSSDAWEEYREAIRLVGACGVVRCPYQPTDIELVLIRVSRDLRQKEGLRLAAAG